MNEILNKEIPFASLLVPGIFGEKFIVDLLNIVSPTYRHRIQVRNNLYFLNIP